MFAEKFKPEITQFLDKNTKLLKICCRSLGVSLNPYFFNMLKEEFKLFLEAVCFFTLKAMYSSVEFFGSEHCLLILPPRNFSKSNILYPCIEYIYDLICQKTDNASCIRPFITHSRANFHTDYVHYNETGLKRLNYMFENFIRFLYRESKQKEPNFSLMASRYNVSAKKLDLEQGLSVKNAFKKRKMPMSEFKDGKRRFEEFQNMHYKFLGSKKSVAIISNSRTLKKSDPPTFCQDKLFAMHTDSLFTILRNGNTEMKKRFLKNKFSFYFPSNFSISPGSSCLNLCQNFSCKDFTQKFEHSAVYSILAFGTNELLQAFGLVCSFMCDLGYIPRERCNVCIRQKFRNDGLHGRPEMVREYLKLMNKN